VHETTLCENVLDILEQQAAEQNFHKVRQIWLEIGLLSCVQAEALQFCFDAIMQGSLAENALLHISAIPGQALCLSCNSKVSIVQLYDPCPACGSNQMQIIAGKEMRIIELEVE
jgi:hydrogenase nickel incorporation protein HypA/HybF